MNPSPAPFGSFRSTHGFNEGTSHCHCLSQCCKMLVRVGKMQPFLSCSSMQFSFTCILLLTLDSVIEQLYRKCDARQSDGNELFFHNYTI